MKYIQLTNGMRAKVDDCDYEWASKQSWYYHKSGPKHGYARGSKDGKKVYLHRLICNSESLVDHINNDTLDNRRKNLRPATKSENMQNTKIIGRGTSRMKGVFKRTLKSGLIKYAAQIQKDKKMKWLGAFDSEAKAAMAYNIAARKIYGKHAKLNKIERRIPA